MNKIFISMLFLALSIVAAAAEPCVNLGEIESMYLVDSDHIHLKVNDVSYELTTTGCATPMSGEWRVILMSATNDLNKICVGDKAMVYLNGSNYSNCQITSMTAYR